ncbi:MAG: hypothetical protein KDA24_11980 [Deltaproteobacteria bacterium]|nr:hypothetical protein [Deltaproteobacteria bacterium]
MSEPSPPPSSKPPAPVGEAAPSGVESPPSTPPPPPAPPPTAPRARRPLTPARLLAFTGFTLFLFLLLLEVALQGLAAMQGPQHHLPDDGSLATPDPAAFRVIAVGDSWVYGAEAEPDEAFIEVFRRSASARLGTPVQVYNLGVSASNSSQALVALHGLVEPVEPHLVVALTGANNRLHDRGVAEAARILGEDARTVPGLSSLATLRTVRLARLIWVNLLAPEHVASTVAATRTVPIAPEPRPSAIVQLPWWDLFVARRWDDALTVLRDVTPPDDKPTTRGLQHAWEALLLAHLGQHSASETLAAKALSLGGDDAAAHEARAVIADTERRGLDALHHRALAAQATGNPVVRELARGRVLLELEAWEPARAWLLSVARAVPGNLETLVALAQLPPTVRTDEVDALLFEGPRGVVTPPEYMHWHLASSGMVDRAVASLGDPDPDEPFPLRVARAEALAIQGDLPGARAAFETLLAELRAAPDTPLHHLDIAQGGAHLHGAPVAAPASTPWVALGQMVALDRAGDCPSAVAAAQRALGAGLLPSDLERRAGPCLPRNTSWTLREMVFERLRPLDREVIAQDPPPAAPPGFWSALRARRFDTLPADTPPEWRALAAAFADQGDLTRDLEEDRVQSGAAPVGEDPAVAALAVAWRALRKGHEKSALVYFAAAAEADGNAWARAFAQGWGATLAKDWEAAQRELHVAESLAPRQLETLDAFRRIPEAVRTRATREAVDLAPVGVVSATRWVEWHLERGQEDRADLATRWPWAQDKGPTVHLAAARTRLASRKAARDAEPDPSPDSALATLWLQGQANPVGSPLKSARPSDPLVRQLDAMSRLAASQGARFVALTYPFPSGHHSEVREVVLAGGVTEGYETLDLYGTFAEEYAPATWEALRTPGDHVNAAGYARMGQELTDWAAAQGLLPASSPSP